MTIGTPVAAARRRADVWYSPSNIVPSLLPCPAVVTIHDVNFRDPQAAYDRRYARYAELMFGRSARHAAHVITVSEYSRRQILAAFGIPGERVTVVYPGIDHRGLSDVAATPVDALPARFALFVGQTEPHKNVSLLLDAWDIGKPADLHLVIAGSPGRDHDRIVERVRRSPLSDRVTILGKVTAGQLRTLYGSARCFVFPSRAEGFGFPPLEAMALGVPTAVARTGSLPEVTGGAAATFDPDDAAELASRVEEIASESPERTRRIADGIAVSGRYRWSAAAQTVWSVVRELGRASSASDRGRAAG